MSRNAAIEVLVDFALSKPCEFAEENFAGDEIFRAFYDSLRDRHELDLSVFVSWSCPPNVLVVRSAVGNAVIRSERLDTLLVEFHHVRRLHNLWSPELAADVARASILRWMCEMLIGFRQPGLAIFAHMLKPDISGIKGLTNPFRDELLASVGDLDRIAIQCFSLGHEVGHLLIGKPDDVSLEEEIDGLSLAQHIEHCDREGNPSDEVLTARRRICKEQLDAGHLLNEVYADLFAFHSVFEFLHSGLSYPVEEAIFAILCAFEAQLFLYSVKNRCRLLNLIASGNLSEREFTVRDYLDGVESSVRARATVRRASLVWAVTEHPECPPSARDCAAYVGWVDAMLYPTQGLRVLLSEVLSKHTKALLTVILEKPPSAREAWCDDLLARVEQDADLRLAFFYILIAFGCPGSVDVAKYLRSVRSTAKQTHGSSQL